MTRFQILKEEREKELEKKRGEFKAYPPIKQMVNALTRSPDCYCEVRVDYEKGIKDQWLRAVHEGKLRVTDGLD